MNKINLLVTEANDNLSKQKDSIFRAKETAEKYAFEKLAINWDIDLVVTNRVYEITIQEDGVGGRTYASDFVLLNIDEKNFSESNLAEMLVHELCHAARWGKNNEWINCLFDGIINEGISTYFESEFAKNRTEKQFFIKTISERSDDENEKILELLKPQLNENQYNYNEIFFNGNEKLPRWAGYSAGYYLVKKYLEKTNKTIEEAFADKYEDFRIALEKSTS